MVMQKCTDLLNITDKSYEISVYVYWVYKEEVWISQDLSGKWDMQWEGFLSVMWIKQVLWLNKCSLFSQFLCVV